MKEIRKIYILLKIINLLIDILSVNKRSKILTTPM